MLFTFLYYNLKEVIHGTVVFKLKMMNADRRFKRIVLFFFYLWKSWRKAVVRSQT